ncbi:MAG TPA: hypothetical protein VHV77_04085 [Pirellulales bacterium]|nr:hypothetical protein [Pirellulales bacterium]
MRTFFFVLLWAAAFWAAGTTASARDIYVSNAGGDDRNDGQRTSASLARGPVATIRRALSIARPGDRVVLTNTGMPYRESVSLSGPNHCGLPGAPFIVEGRGALIDGSYAIPHEAWEGSGLMLSFTPGAMTYQQLFAGTQPFVRRHVLEGDDSLPLMRANEWCLYRRRIYFQPELDKSLLDYDLRCAGMQTGVTLYHVHDVEVHNLVVRGFWLDGINAHDGVSRGKLIGVTCQSNGRSGITIAGSSQCDVFRSTVGGNGTSQVNVEGLAIAGVVNSKVVGDTAPPFVRNGGYLSIDHKRVEGVR